MSLTKLVFKILFETKVTYARMDIVKKEFDQGTSSEPQVATSAKQNVQHQQGCYIIIYNTTNGTHNH